MQVKPLFDKVVIKAIESSETTESGIVLPAPRRRNPSLPKSSPSVPAVWWTARKSLCR